MKKSLIVFLATLHMPLFAAPAPLEPNCAVEVYKYCRANWQIDYASEAECRQGEYAIFCGTSRQLVAKVEPSIIG